MDFWKPLLFSIGLMLFMLVVIPFVVNGVVSEPVLQNTSMIAPLNTLLVTGVDVSPVSQWNWTVSVFDLIPGTEEFRSQYKASFVERFNAFSYVPDWLMFPLVTLMVLGFLVGTIMFVLEVAKTVSSFIPFT